MEFYKSTQSGQFYMINVLENQWLSVTNNEWGERLNVPLKEAKPSWIEHFIFHQMKISVPSHEWKTFIICFI